MNLIDHTSHKDYLQELDAYEWREIRNKMKKTIPDMDGMMKKLLEFNISEHNFKDLEKIFIDIYGSFDPTTGGFTDLTNKKIYILKDLNHNMKNHIVLHEFMHLMYYDLNFPYDNERLVDNGCKVYKSIYPCVTEVINDFMEWQ